MKKTPALQKHQIPQSKEKNQQTISSFVEILFKQTEMDHLQLSKIQPTS